MPSFPEFVSSSQLERVPPLQLKHISCSCQRSVRLRNLTSVSWPRPTRPSILPLNSSFMTRQQHITALGREVVSVASARSSRVSVVKETKHHWARTSHVVLFSTAKSTLLSPTSRLGNNLHDLIHTRVHERCHDVVEHYAARTMPPVTIAARLTIILQAFKACVQRVRRASRPLPPWLPRTCSFATFCHHSVIQPCAGVLAVHVPQRHQLIDARGFVSSAQSFQSIQILCHFRRHNVLVCCVLTRRLSRVRRRSRRRLGLPARTFPDP